MKSRNSEYKLNIHNDCIYSYLCFLVCFSGNTLWLINITKNVERFDQEQDIQIYVFS